MVFAKLRSMSKFRQRAFLASVAVTAIAFTHFFAMKSATSAKERYSEQQTTTASKTEPKKDSRDTLTELKEKGVKLTSEKEMKEYQTNVVMYSRVAPMTLSVEEAEAWINEQKAKLNGERDNNSALRQRVKEKEKRLEEIETAFRAAVGHAVGHKSIRLWKYKNEETQLDEETLFVNIKHGGQWLYLALTTDLNQQLQMAVVQSMIKRRK